MIELDDIASAASLNGAAVSQEIPSRSSTRVREGWQSRGWPKSAFLSIPSFFYPLSFVFSLQLWLGEIRDRRVDLVGVMKVRSSLG